MATRKEYQLAVGRATTNVRAKTQTLNETQASLSEAQAILADLKGQWMALSVGAPGYDALTIRVATAQTAVQREQDRLNAARSELNQAKTDLTSAQLELTNPEAKFDPEPTQASDAVTLTQEQRTRLDQINQERIDKDQTPLTPGDPAALAAVNASFAAEQKTETAAAVQTASTNTAGDAVANQPAAPIPVRPPKEATPQTTTQNIDGGSIKYVVNTDGGTTVLLLDDTGATVGYGSDIAGAIDTAAKRGASPGLLTSAASEYQTAGEQTVQSLKDKAGNPYWEEDANDAASNRETQNTGTSTYDKNDRLLASENLKAGLNASGVGEPGMLPADTTQPKRSTATPSVDDAAGKTKANAQSAISSVTTAGGSEPMSVKSVDNPLHAYPDYTYSLSLHVLSPANYKQLVDNPTLQFKPTVTLVSSANKYNKSPPRDQAFTDDFYFDGLKMTTVIGLGNSSRGTNVNDLSFNLIEPYGMTLLNRLLDMNVRLGHKNYLDVPYLLEINFLGYDDKGMFSKLENHTKYIPIRLVTMKIKAGTRGSEYAITAIPYNKISHLQSIQTVKSNFEITARTVGDFFSSKGSDYAATAASINTAAAADKAAAVAAAQTAKDSTRVPAGSTSTAAAPTPKIAAAKTITSSFTQAFNLWNEQSKKHGAADVADIIEFIIDPAISSSTIVEPLTANPARSAGQTSAGTATAGSQTNRPAASPAPVGANFTQKNSVIAAGTSITKVINEVLINSSFIRNQLKDSETTSSPQPDKKNAPADANSLLKTTGSSVVKWFKITSKIELLAYDDYRGMYGKKIIFFINSYDHYQSSFPGAPKGQPTGAVKSYDYMYTGKNRDIIDFEIKFDTLFVNVINMDKNKIMEMNTNPWAGSPNKIKTKRDILPAYNLQPTQLVNTSGTQESITGGSDETSAKQQAANFAENIYSSAGGDMVELKMKIIGDPHFIKQDEVLFSPDKSMNSKGQWVDKEGGSLSMDRGEIYCNITFKSPVDIDETTGLLRQGSKWKDVYFSGLYKINTVESEFKQGKFIQTINGFRIKNQKGDAKGPQTSTGTSRSDPTTASGASNSAVAGQSSVAGNPSASTSGGVGGTRGVAPNTVTQTYGEFGESYTIITDNKTDKQYRRTADGATEEIPRVSGQIPDRPGSDPALQAVRDNAATTDDYENAGMSSAPARLPLPDELSADPNQVALRNVAQNGPTGTIEANSADTGEPIVGAPSASTQAAAPPQPAPVINEPVPSPAATTPVPAPATQTPPVQTAPQPAPATAVQRQSTAATAQIESLTAQSRDIVNRYSALYTDYKINLDKLSELSKVIAESDKLIAQTNNTEQLGQLVEIQRTAIAKQQALLDSMEPKKVELEKLSAANAEIGKQIASIKANTTNEDAELNALSDAADARQRATTKF